jgi:glycosyltransferase involved in cell wall biosynthesis
LTGALSDAERDLAFFSCDVMALPSQSEGFGIAYLEAMAHGKPCLAARAGGAPEVVLHGETGLVVEPTVEAVRAALLQLCDAGLRQRLGAAGRARVASHFTYDSFRTRAFALFDRLGQP